jgi:glucokinase
VASEKYFLGADTGGTGIKFVLTGTNESILAEGEVPTNPQDMAACLNELAASVALTLETVETGASLAAVGMACAGIVDPVSGHLGRSPNLPGWENTNLAAALRVAFPGLPIALANDVNGALYGEFRSGAGRGCGNLAMIALGTGVGGGIIVDGKLLLGAHHGGAEIGHMVLDLDGPLCTCGSRGCLEAWAGSTGLMRRARELDVPASVKTTRDLASLALAGDSVAQEIFTEAGRRLGQAAANLINLLDPERVIVGGGVARAGDLILEPCRKMIPSLVMAEGGRKVPVVEAELGTHAAAVGAAYLAREQEQTT